jgi:hypothetical protein
MLELITCERNKQCAGHLEMAAALSRSQLVTLAHTYFYVNMLDPSQATHLPLPGMCLCFVFRVQGTCVSVTARGFVCSINDLPPLEHLRVLRVGRLDDLVTVLTKTTNLQWLECVVGVGAAALLPSTGSALTAPNLRVLQLRAGFDIPQVNQADYQQLAIQHDLQVAEVIASLQSQHLKCLMLELPFIQSLPAALCELQGLKALDVLCCTSLQKLPERLGRLQPVRYLSMTGCSSLT